jgi:hypothetical protein
MVLKKTVALLTGLDVYHGHTGATVDYQTNLPLPHHNSDPYINGSFTVLQEHFLISFFAYR